MKYVIVESITDPSQGKTAILKARDDIETVASRCGYTTVKVEKLDDSIAFSHKTHLAVYKNWKSSLPKLKKGDEILIQLPLRQHTLLLPLLMLKMKANGVRIYGLIHDLDILRLAVSDECPFDEKIRRHIEEKRALSLCDSIIVHNKVMKEKLIEYGYKESKLIELEIFDYLSEDTTKDWIYDKSLIVAGNLSRSKSAYVYELPKGVRVNLYGINYDGNQNEGIVYHGSFSPDQLPNVVEGSFGLVWDGESIDTCTGAYGAYLRINNPHKTSFYLSCGIPVIIWKEAALAKFVESNKCGVLVESLRDIPEILETITNEEYQGLKRNTDEIAKKLKSGYYTKAAIHKAEKQ